MSGSIQNGNLTSVHHITKHKHPHFKDNVRSQYLLQIKIYITLSFRWHIQIMFTHRQMHLSPQDCYNPLTVRQKAPCGLALQLGCFQGVIVHFPRELRNPLKEISNTCGLGFSFICFPHCFSPLGGVGEMVYKHCIIPF